MKDKPLILAVDCNKRNRQLLVQFLSKEGYQVLEAGNVEAFDQVLTKANAIAVALVDIAGFDLRIWERCDRLRTENIPFLVLSPRQTVAIQQQSLAHGAHNTLIKPLVSRELLLIIRSLLKN